MKSSRRKAGWISLVVACGLAAQCHLWGATTLVQSSAGPSIDTLSPESRGDLLMVRQQYVQAIEAYRDAPMNAVLWNKLGIAYHHMLAFDEAKRDYEHALKLEPEYPEAINNLAAAYFAEKKYRKSIHLYRRALKLRPRSAVIAANLGTAYFAEGRFQSGIEEYQTAFALDPTVFGASNMATIEGGINAHDRARQDFCIAELFAQAGMRDHAIEYLRKALDEGFGDRSRIMQDSDFAQLRKTSQFAQLMAEEKLH